MSFKTFLGKEIMADLRTSAQQMDANAARTLVDQYYSLQNMRIRAGNQTFAADENEEPNEFTTAVHKGFEEIEKAIAVWLDDYSAAHPVGRWARNQIGVGPVLAAALLAHVNPERSTTVSALWSFAGYNPEAVWEKGQKRPWNATLKVVGWKIGESFVKVSGNPDAKYGQLWKARKAWEWEMNLAGAYAERSQVRRFGEDTGAVKWTKGWFNGASVSLKGEARIISVDPSPEFIDAVKRGAKLDFRKARQVFLDGTITGRAVTGLKPKMTDEEVAALGGVKMLPPAAIHARAKRFAVKRFLSHFWAKLYEHHYQKPAPEPWIISHGHHADYDRAA